MGMFTDEFGNIRWRAGGVLLAIALGIALLPPMLRQKEIGHPRSGEQKVDLCPILPEPPAPLADAARQPVVGGSAMCEFKSKNDVALTVGLTTTRELSAG